VSGRSFVVLVPAQFRLTTNTRSALLLLGLCSGPRAYPAPDGPDGAACTWRKKRRVKTIDSRCLFEDHAFRDRCKADARVPFTTAVGAFKDAFASEDGAAGGCPALELAGCDSRCLGAANSSACCNLW